jgi:osmotically-inducible protein OsmY
MARDRSYDRGRAWRGGNEEEGGYGQSGMMEGDYGLHRPRIGRPVDEPSRGNVDYVPVPGMRERGIDRDASNASYRGAGLDGYTRGSHRGRGPRGYRRSDDRIAEDVNDAFTENPRLDPTEISVSVENGEVTLEGTVESRAAKRLAEDIADAVAGVHDVHNRLRIETNGRPDADPVDPPTL